MWPNELIKGRGRPAAIRPEADSPLAANAEREKQTETAITTTAIAELADPDLNAEQRRHDVSEEPAITESRNGDQQCI